MFNIKDIKKKYFFSNNKLNLIELKNDSKTIHNVMSYGFNNHGGKYIADINILKYLALNPYKNYIEKNCFNKEKNDFEKKNLPLCFVEYKTQYYLSECYLKNKHYKKAFYISLNTIKFIELNDMVSYINDVLIVNDSLLSNQYFKSNISMFYIYFKMYNNIIELSKHYYNYDGEIYRDKYINEIEYIINNWKY